MAKVKTLFQICYDYVRQPRCTIINTDLKKNTRTTVKWLAFRLNLIIGYKQTNTIIVRAKKEIFTLAF